ncbi:hypothetical protein HAX54_047021 [Datura stramonium]|uniref:Uncharacterized protein n=1 Tax=Datura stramonium TaxID=4076 RepID=A0ABS8SSB9_DATST|nr:hypothetical protein [Datura stramonium]
MAVVTGSPENGGRVAVRIEGVSGSEWKKRREEEGGDLVVHGSGGKMVRGEKKRGEWEAVWGFVRKRKNENVDEGFGGRGNIKGKYTAIQEAPLDPICSSTCETYEGEMISSS